MYIHTYVHTCIHIYTHIYIDIYTQNIAYASVEVPQAFKPRS